MRSSPPRCVVSRRAEISAHAAQVEPLEAAQVQGEAEPTVAQASLNGLEERAARAHVQTARDQQAGGSVGQGVLSDRHAGTHASGLSVIQPLSSWMRPWRRNWLKIRMAVSVVVPINSANS